MASEQFSSVDLTSGGDQFEEAQEENSKPSFMNKVKAKALKLKSKFKHHGSEDSHDETPGETPAADDRIQANARKYADEDTNESDTTEVHNEGKENQYVSTTPVSNTDFPQPQRPPGATDPKPEDSPFSAVNSGQSGYGMDSEHAGGKSFPVDPNVVKSDEPSGNQKELPTDYSNVNSDPEQTTLPSDNHASQRQQDDPSTFGGFSEGMKEDMQNSNSVAAGNVSMKREDALSKSGDKDSELPRPMEFPDLAQENDEGVVEPSQPSQDSLLSHPMEQDQGLTGKASDHDESYEGMAAVGATAAGAGGVASDMDQSKDSSDDYSNAATQIPQRKALQTSLSNDSGSKKVDSEMRTSSDPELVGKSNTKSEGEDSAAENSTWTQKVHNSVVGAKDGAVATVGGSTESAPTGNTPVDNSQTKPLATRTVDSAYGMMNSLATTLGYDGTSASQAKDSVASDASANAGEQKPMMNKGIDNVDDVKDTATSELGSADQAMSTDSKPASQKATDSIVQAQDSVASNRTTSGLEDNDGSKVGNPQEAASQVQDGLLQKPAPDHDDKATAGSVTESITNLPGMLTSKLGLGGGSTTSSPTQNDSSTPTSDGSTNDSSMRKDTPHPHQPAAAPESLLDRMSGLATSLFGGGAKPTATPIDGEKPSS